LAEIIQVPDGLPGIKFAVKWAVLPDQLQQEQNSFLLIMNDLLPGPMVKMPVQADKV
jgi:hypothetical protein